MHYNHPLLKKDILQARDYQLSILETIKEKNSLVVLPTGLGKTPMAIMLTVDRLEKYPDSKIMILAPTKPLVNQHYKTFSEFLSMDKDELEVITGIIKPGERKKLYEKKKIFFETPQTLKNDLKNKIVSLNNFSLLVVDEAHHSIGSYAYTYVTKKYIEQAKNARILGLTASPGGTREKIKQICKNIFVEAVEIRSDEDQDVSPYIQEKKIEWIEVELPESFLKVKTLLQSVFNKRVEKLRSLNFARRYVSKKVLLELQSSLMRAVKKGYKKALMGVFNTTQAIKIEHALGLLETQGIGILETYMKKLRQDKTKSAQALINDSEFVAAMHMIHDLYEDGAKHPKIGKLCSLVSEEMNRNPDVRIIIFANYRDTVKEISGTLIKIDGARPIALIGQKEGLSQKEQIETIHGFERGESNIIITTSIGEEGLHLTSADIAVFYDSVPSEIRNIQRRGRVGRTKIGRIIFLITKGTRDEAYRWAAHHKEKKMKKTLHDMQTGQKGLDDFS